MNNHSDWTWEKHASFPSVLGASREFLTELLAALHHEQWTPQDIFAVHLSVEEALVNAIRHGNRCDSGKRVQVECKLSPRRLFLEVTDEGTGFDPEKVPDCTQQQNWQRSSGRGIMLMRNYMSRVEYTDGGHRLVMEKVRDEKLRNTAG